jgi:hypothetical protein
MTRHHYIIEFSVPGKIDAQFRTSCSVLVTENTTAGDVEASLNHQAIRYVKETMRVDVSPNWLRYHVIAHVHTTNK